MRTSLRAGLLGGILGVTALAGSVGRAHALDDTGVGFVLKSKDFGAPCTVDSQALPRIYGNATGAPVDASVKILNPGAANVFVHGTGFVIPPSGPLRRPRVVRVTVPAGGSLGLAAQGPPCEWIAVISPH